MKNTIKKCPFCSEEIKYEAVKCRFCGELLNSSNDLEINLNREKDSTKLDTYNFNIVYSIILIVSFFLPWFSIPFFNLSGFEIPTSIDKIILLSSMFGKNMDILKISYLLYSIPIVCIFNILVDIKVIKRNYFINEFFISLSCTLIVYYILSDFNEKLTQTLGIGFYLTVIISVLGLIMTNPLLKKLINQINKNINLLK